MDTRTRKVFEHLRGIGSRAMELIHDLEARRRLVDQYFHADPSTWEMAGTFRPVEAGPVPMEWVWAEGADPGRRILFIHGGSWISGSPAGYRAFVSRVSRATGAVVLSVDYRLAPEHPFPAGLEDCLAACEWMRKTGPDGEKPADLNFLMGDSAGGNLALVCLLKQKDEEKPLPTALIALSPSTDITGGSPSLASRAGLDPIINPKILPALIPIYLRDRIEPRHPYASPLFGDYRGLPPLFLQAGMAEVLLDDTTRLASHAAGQGCQVTLDIWHGMPHVFQGFAPFLPQASEAIEKIGRFVRRF